MNTFVSPFGGVELIVVEDGHEFHDDMSGQTHVVTKGNMVTQGTPPRRVYLVQQDYDAIKSRLQPKNDPTPENSA